MALPNMDSLKLLNEWLDSERASPDLCTKIAYRIHKSEISLTYIESLKSPSIQR